VDQYNKAGYTANMCTLDVSKAFDKVNHHALCIKLIASVSNSGKPLDILENWLSGCYGRICLLLSFVWG